MTDFPFPNLADIRLARCIDQWQKVQLSAPQWRQIGIIYHGDVDGLVGAAYARRVLMESNPILDIRSFWIATEEYDFQTLMEWVGNHQFDACVILDISIENHVTAMRYITTHVKDFVFVFDHHIIHTPFSDVRAVIANPTPSSVVPPNSPVPTFMFALALARQHHLSFPPWLLLMCIFSEGVDSFMTAETASLCKTVLAMRADERPRDVYRGSILGRAASLLRTGFTLAEKHGHSLEIVSKIIANVVRTPEALAASLELSFGYESKRMQGVIDYLLSEWRARLSEIPALSRLVIIPINDVHAVATVVASVLRASFPGHVIMTWVRYHDNAVIELRTDNQSSLNLVSFLSLVALEVPLINYGGHAPAAGATVRYQHLDHFCGVLSRIVDASS